MVNVKYLGLGDVIYIVSFCKYQVMLTMRSGACANLGNLPVPACRGVD